MGIQRKLKEKTDSRLKRFRGSRFNGSRLEEDELVKFKVKNRIIPPTRNREPMTLNLKP